MVSPGSTEIHDAQLDYYGKLLASARGDGTITIFEVDGESTHQIDTLKGHDSAVWALSWAHPKFGVILASASYDGKVILWKREKKTWKNIAQHTSHQASVNAVAWGPQEYGPVFATASSDGTISIAELKSDNTLEVEILPAHQSGVNAVSWAPALPATGAESTTRRIVSAADDNLVKIWKKDGDKYELEHTLEGHSDWVRDVAWSPSLLSKSYIASASRDKTVIIWTQQGTGSWEKKLLRSDDFPGTVWRVSWSLSGNILAVSGETEGESQVSLWKETIKGDWESAGEIDA